jgi:hypothetical protein
LASALNDWQAQRNVDNWCHIGFRKTDVIPIIYDTNYPEADRFARVLKAKRGGLP